MFIIKTSEFDTTFSSSNPILNFYLNLFHEFWVGYDFGPFFLGRLRLWSDNRRGLAFFFKF
jgi:hypothetical protein